MTELVMKPTTATKGGTVVRTRKARTTGQPVSLVKHELHDYEVQCIHGNALRGNKRYEVARKAASPEEWCEECATAKAEREAEREAPDDAEAEEAEDATEETQPEPAFDITDAAADLAGDYGIDLAEIDGTGVDGRILVSDVRQAVKELEAA